MIKLVADKHDELMGLCARYRVARLDLFGSAAVDKFDPRTSDLDFLVRFESMPPAQHADCFFGLQADLEGLFGCVIDLVEPSAIRNPYLWQTIEQERVVLYAAA
ncbi:MAG: nucleotidyltransferase domain-containing protein [Planctomycetota bacterium]